MIILAEANRNNIYTLNYIEINNLVIKYRNFILYDYYYHYEYEKFKDYFIIYSYYNYELERIEYSNYSGVYHREDGPAFIKHDRNGKIYRKQYYINGEKYSYEDYVLEITKLV